MFTVAVLGLGQFGFAISKHLANKYKDNKKVVIKGFELNEEVRTSLKTKRAHPYHFPNAKIIKKFVVVNSLKRLLKNTDLLILAIPAQTIRQNIKTIRPLIKKNIIILNVAKALELKTDLPIDKIIHEELSGLKKDFKVAALAGAMIASEMVKNVPLGCDIACKDIKTADKLRDFFSNKFLRAYSTDDILGVEYAGAIKNVIAIGAGICDGLGFPLSTKTFLIAGSAKEGLKLGNVIGAKESTFSSYSQCWGSDLNLSCMGDTRNRLFGEYIGKGWGVKRALDKLKSEHKIAEGYATAKVLHDLESLKHLNFPILENIYQILYENKNPKKSAKELMDKKPKRLDSKN